MTATSARVRWLDGTVREVRLEGGGEDASSPPPSIASLRAAVAALSGLAGGAPPTRKNCKLYLRGVELLDDSAPLQIDPGETVACVVRAESKRRNRRARARGTTRSREEEEGAEAAAEVAQEETEARAPVRRPPPPPPPAPPSVPPPGAPEAPVQAEVEEEQDLEIVEGPGEEEEEEDPLLPPALRALERAFRPLLAAYDFVSRRQLRPTLALLASVAAPMLASASVSASAFASSSSATAAVVIDGPLIGTCASLCPEMISLRGGGRGEKREGRKMIKDAAAAAPPPLSPTTALLSSVVAAAPPCPRPSPNDGGEGARAREALDDGSPFLEISKIRTRGAASAPRFPLPPGGGQESSAPPPRTRVAAFRTALLRAAAAASAAGLPRDAPLEAFVRAFEEASRRAKRAEEEEAEEQQQQEKKRRERRKRGQGAREDDEAAASVETAGAAAPPPSSSSSAALTALLRADDARHQLSVADFIAQRLAGAPWYSGQIEHGRTLRPRAARFLRVPRFRDGEGGGGDGDDGNPSSLSSSPAALRGLMTPPLLAAAAAAGVGDGGRALYEHQARALLLSAASSPSSPSSASSSPRPFIVVAPTAAGKSLCFVLPMLRALLLDPFATALLLYPTKALGADQLASVRRALAAAGLDGDGAGTEEEEDGGEERQALPPVAALFDGDVPAAEREKLLPRSARSSSSSEWAPPRTRVLLANPDVVHASLLPAATSGSGTGSCGGATRFVAGLALVAVDEAHSFSGAFACHASLVLRRLRRSCEAAKALVAMGRAAGGGGRGRGGGGAAGGGGRRRRSGGGGENGENGTLSPEAEADAAAARPPPLFVAASATIGNPGEHAAALLPLSADERRAAGKGGGVEVIQGDGSEAGAKTFLLWNPPTLAGAPDAAAPSTATVPRSSSSSHSAAAAAAAAAALPSKRARQEAVRAAVREAEQARLCGPRLQMLPPPPLPPSSPVPPPSLPDQDPSGVEEVKQDPFGLPKDEWLTAARLGKVRARAAADAAASLPPPPPQPKARVPAAAPALPPPQPPLSPGRGRLYLAPLTTTRAPPPFAAAAADDDDDEAAAAAPTSLLPRPPLLSMEEVQRQQEELAAASRQQQQQQRATRTTARSSRSALPQGPRSLLLVGAGNPARPGEAGGVFDAAAALLLRRGKGGEKKRPGGTFNIANGGLPSSSDPASQQDSAAAAASLAAAVAAREAGEAARSRSAVGALAPAAAGGGGAGGAAGLPRWRERHGAAGVDAGDRRSSAIVECGLLLAECVRARLRTLAFCKTRKLAELVAAHASQRLRELEERDEKEGGGGGGSRSSKKRRNAATTAAATKTSNSSSSSAQPLLPPLSSRVAAYRAGYDPRARRAIEGALASGRVLGVAATNALELGIDLPLDATLHLGLPARAATLAQQSGRAGRFGSASLHVAIAFDGPLDQWYVRHPERFFGRLPEPAGGGFDPWSDSALSAATTTVAPQESGTTAAAAAAVSRTRKVDEGILALHVACAAAECPPLDPTPEGDDARLYFGPRLPAVAAGLVAAGALVGGDWWSGSGSGSGRGHTGAKNSPSSSSLRGAEGRARAAAEAVVAKGTPLFFAGVVAGGSGNGRGALLAPSSALAPSPSRSSSLSSLPHSTFGLRAIDETRFSIVDDASGTLLEEMEASKAFFVVYDGAIVLRHARPHLCVSLCTASRVARIRPAPRCNFYTSVRDMKDVHVVGGRNLYLPPRRRSLPRPEVAAPASASSLSSPSSSSFSSPPPSPAVAADALVTTRFLGYLKIWRATNRIFDSVDLHLPDVQLRTRAAFCRVPASAAARCRDELGLGGGSGLGKGGGGGRGKDDEEENGENGENNGTGAAQPELREGLHAACHALAAAAPAILGCDAADLGTECDSPYDSRFRPMRLLLWEKNGSGGSGSGNGGGGLAERAADAFGELLVAALDIVSSCRCSSANGCPECVFWSGCSEYNAVLHRGAARIVLEETIRAAAAFGGGGGGGGDGGDGQGGGGLF